MEVEYEFITPILPFICFSLYYISALAFIIGLYPVFTTPPYVWDMLGLDIEDLILFYTSYSLATVFCIYMIYKLISERNIHFRRQYAIERKIIELFKDKNDYISTLKDITKKGDTESSERNVIFWIALAIFLIFPIYYIIHFLNEEFYKHETREDKFLGILNKIGISIPSRKYRVRKRSFKKYFLLTIISMGLFGLYWAYIVIREINLHFEYQLKWESLILSFINL